MAEGLVKLLRDIFYAIENELVRERLTHTFGDSNCL